MTAPPDPKTCRRIALAIDLNSSNTIYHNANDARMGRVPVLPKSIDRTAFTKFGPGMAVTAIVILGLNLRTPITSLASILPSIQDDLSMSPTMAGVVSSIPVICFGAGALLVTPIAGRFGINRTIFMSMLALSISIAIRPFGNDWLIIISTLVIGLAITSGNVLLPVIVRRDFPHRQGPVMAASTTSITASGTIGAALTVPIAIWFGWQVALASWAILSLVSLATLRFLGPDNKTLLPARGFSVWKIPAAWTMALFFGFQAGLFYTSTVWLPTILMDLARISYADAGLAASLFQAFGIIGAFVAPIVVNKYSNRKAFSLTVSSLWIIYALGLILSPENYLIWIIIGGIAQGSVVALHWSLVALRACDLAMVRDLSSMTQAVGYGIAALTPIIFGMLFQATGTWHTGLILPVVMAVAITALSPLVASRKDICVGPTTCSPAQ